ncbi:MAG: phosphomannomutase/phosphoglucomutase [Actinobacteria bacterium]|nr:phosphomannomutase/phosphoglucomutase [Actinomycetota bacterium]
MGSGKRGSGGGSHDEILDGIFKAYDIRGLVPEQLDEDLIRRIGAAAARVLDASAVVVGHDMRPSSPGFVEAFAAGVTSQGVDVVHVGLASTDMLYFASGDLDLPGAMFTASHNPAGYNGIKLCRAGAVPVSIDSGLAQIRDLVRSDELADQGSPGAERERGVLPRFAEHVRGFVDREALRPLKVVVDAANGMAGHVVPAVFDGLPFEIDPLYFELDGSFPNHPADPSDEANLRDLRDRVRETGADVGLAFDGDADRSYVVDERGEPVVPSLVGAMVADRILEKRPGETVLYNLICSRIVPETVEAAGGKPVRTRVGHSFIKQRMAETGAVYGCEHSAHYYFRDNYRADSGLIAAVLLLEAVSIAGAPLSEVMAPYDRYAQSGEINFQVDDQEAVLDSVADAFGRRGSVDWADGLTVELEDLGDTWGWFNLRPSNTEPLLRLNVEGEDRGTMERIRDEVTDHVRQLA